MINTSQDEEGKTAALKRAVLVTLLLFLLPLAALAQSDTYRLVTGDRVAVRVLSWNQLTLKFEVLDALQGTFAVNSAGQLSLPLLQPVDVTEQPLNVLATDVGRLYQERLGLSEAPSVSFEVTEYGPIYVIGDVARPGQFDFAPGLTAIQAFALAGGVHRLIDSQPDGASGAIRATGSLSEIEGELVRLGMTRSRLLAEYNGDTTFERPDLSEYPASSSEIEDLYVQENGLFDSRRERLERAIASIDETRSIVDTELKALDGKLDGIRRQLSLVRESVGNAETLVERGLARTPTLVNLQRTQIELETRELDAETAIFRARQRRSDLDREASDLVIGRRAQVLEELQGTEARIARLETRRSMTRRLLAGAEALIASEEQPFRTDLEFEIRRGDTIVRATESAQLRPRDVLVVTLVTTPK